MRYEICQGSINLISSTWKLPCPLSGEKLRPQIALRLRPSFGAPGGCQSERRVKVFHERSKVLQPLKLSLNLYSKRSAVSLLPEAEARLSKISKRIVAPLFVP